MGTGTSGSTVSRGIVHVVLGVALMVLAASLAGCEAMDEYGPAWGGPDVPAYQSLSDTYEQIEISKSLTLDVLPKMDALSGEVKVQSESAVASIGQSEDGQRSWYTLVAFHQYNLSVIRKYFYLIDEKARSRSRRGLKFDCEILLDPKLAGAVDDTTTQRLAILTSVLPSLRRDIANLSGAVGAQGSASETFDLSLVVLNQAFKLAMLKLNASPALVSRLDDSGGVEFSHMSFGTGRIGLVVENGVGTLKLRLGGLADRFEE